jgi:hypothetical protein
VAEVDVLLGIVQQSGEGSAAGSAEAAGGVEGRGLRMPTWEYLTWTVYEGQPGLESVRLVNGKPHAGDDELGKALSRAGADGWEVASTHSTGDNWATYVFKRPRQQR